ncbi:MAG: sulfatase [Mailhella sp.]|nr:sulfatase [Mailhella sp.]
MPKSVIVCMFDSLQFNYLGCYGNDWIKTPNFDRFAREGVLFENAYGEGMPTVPTRRVLHTGCATLGNTGWSPLRMCDTTISDLCWGQGIDTALIFDCPMYRLPKYGYTRGFDKVYFIHGHEGDHAYYHKNPLIHKDPKDYLSPLQMEKADEILRGPVIGPLLGELADYLRQRQYWHSEADQNCPRVMQKAVAYLKDVDRNQPFYLWVDSFDPHEPWDPPSVYDPDLKCPYDPDYEGVDMFLPVTGAVEGLYTEAELNHIRMLYAEKVSVCDRALGYFMDNVRELGFEDNTLFIVISDHGEPMGNDKHGHGIMRKSRPWPYEELVHIPLMIKGPGIPAGKRINALVQNYDISATIVNWLGIKGSEAMDSIDLMPLVLGQTEKIRDYVITGYHNAAWAIFTEEWSYVHWLVEQALVNSTAGTNLGMMDGNDGGVKADDIANFNIDNEGREALERYKKGLTLDGADQWTCTPGSVLEAPDTDQLFDRKKDPFQLSNVISQHPDVAAKLLRELNNRMEELKR